jgi:hypothetical protein
MPKRASDLADEAVTQLIQVRRVLRKRESDLQHTLSLVQAAQTIVGRRAADHGDWNALSGLLREISEDVSAALGHPPHSPQGVDSSAASDAVPADLHRPDRDHDSDDIPAAQRDPSPDRVEDAQGWPGPPSTPADVAVRDPRRPEEVDTLPAFPWELPIGTRWESQMVPTQPGDTVATVHEVSPTLPFP